ncbi:MAG: hypothetical protein K2G28_13035 [Acetatifactor sp.]|nr:hypothetical protein [Acetatifactor sp.]MDE7352931.1 hypothetical protein [Acetatifactor sp.]
MEQRNWLELMSKQTQLQQILDTNQYTERFGLALSREDAELLTEERKKTLKKEGRVEFGQGVLPKIIQAFCDSCYITQDNYTDTLVRLQEIFFLYKNEMLDEITDDELLEFMKEQFENVCFGDLDYLEGTCLNIFAQAIRAGYSGFTETQGRNEWAQFDIAERWSRELYLQALGGLI